MKKTIKLLLITFVILSTFCLFTSNVFAATTATIIDPESVFVRSGPGTNNSSVILLSYGTSVVLVNTTKHADTSCDGKSNCTSPCSGWYQINYEGNTNRYICSDLVSIAPEIGANTAVGYYTTTNWGTRINEDYAIVRSYPGGDYIENIYLGTPVSVIEKSYATAACSEGWTKISYYNGKTGYVCDRLISSYANLTARDSTYEQELDAAGFPESYWPFLVKLHQQHPTWKFKAIQTGINFNTAISSEINNCYIQSTESSYILDNIVRENPGWYAAAPSVIAVMLDTRNYLTEKNIFAFENLNYDSELHTIDTIKNLFANNYLSTGDYPSYFINAASTYNISPINLAVRVKQEGGTDPNYAGVNGQATTRNGLTYNGQNLDGVYNFFNIGSHEDSVTSSSVTRGLAVAKGLVDSYSTAPWDTPQKSINAGASLLSNGYINAGQYTLYFQKFNTSPTAKFNHFTNQFMTNVTAPLSESLSTYNAYYSSGLLDTAFVFSIPIYESTPDAFTSHPITGDTNTNLANIKIDNIALDGFDSSVLDYTYYVASSKTSVNIKASTQTSTSSITGNGNITLNSEGNETLISLIVTSQVGTTKVYTIKIIKVDVGNQTATELIDILDVKVNNTNMFMSGIEEKTSIDNLTQTITQTNPNAIVTFTDKNLAAKTSGKIATGDKIKIVLNDETLEYTLAIKGDINGDGEITLSDLIRIQKHLLNYTTYEGIYLYACDTNYDSQVNLSDLIKVQKHLLKYITLK